MFRKESQSFQLLATNGGGAQRWLSFLSQHIHIQVGKDTNFPIYLSNFCCTNLITLPFCQKTLKFSAGFCLQPPRFIVFYLRGCGHCRRSWGENPGHLGEGEPPKIACDGYKGLYVSGEIWLQHWVICKFASIWLSIHAGAWKGPGAP